MDERLTAEQEAIALLETIPGVGQRAAEILIAAIGTAYEPFPQRQASCLVGGDVSRASREWGEALAWEDTQRPSLAPADSR